jgi:dihydroxy-acid dehydratase
MALGGSTNAIIHLIATRRPRGATLDLDRFDALSRRTPFIANIRPAASYLMEDFFYAAPRARLDVSRTSAHRLRHRQRRTTLQNVSDALVCNDAVIATRERPLGPEGASPCSAETSHPGLRLSNTRPPKAVC